MSKICFISFLNIRHLEFHVFQFAIFLQVLIKGPQLLLQVLIKGPQLLLFTVHEALNLQQNFPYRIRLIFDTFLFIKLLQLLLYLHYFFLMSPLSNKPPVWKV